MSELKCTQCGQKLPADPLPPVMKTGVVMWVKADGTEAAFEVDGQLHRAWEVYCPTLKVLTLSVGDRVELAFTHDKYSPSVVRVALPAQVLVTEPEPV